jgi:DNA repair protein RadD
MKLRDYQEASVAAIFRYFQMGGQGNPLVALPTGTGKSVVIGDFIRQVFTLYPGQRIMKLTHVKELIEQNLEKLLTLWPTAPAGVYSAGLDRRDVRFPIIFGGIASVVKSPELFGRIDLIMIDEAHLVSPHDGTMYQKFITALRQVNPYMKVIGFTATQYRLDQGKLVNGDDSLFTDVCFDMTQLENFNWFIDNGYLVPLIPKRTQTILDVSGVKIRAGEYAANALQAAVDIDSVTNAVLKEMVSLAGDTRNHWLVFCSGVDHAEHVSNALNVLGIVSTFVHSKMSKAARDEAIEGFRDGRYRAICNNGILTTGFDYPAIDLIGMLRPTQSPGLWVQMLGRGTRPVYVEGYNLETVEGRKEAIANSEKPNCLVLDFAGNTRRLGPINDPVIPRPRQGDGTGEAPVKLCDYCGTYNHASVRVCINCGAEFPVAVKIVAQASTQELLAKSSPIVESFTIDRINYTEHRKADKPPSIRVSYFCGLRMFNEWICFEHPGYPRKKAHDWWWQRAGTTAPESTAEALRRLNELHAPARVKVWINKQYPEIMDYEF